MTAGKHMKPYPEYKESGVEWLGEVPEQWDVSRIKFNTYVKARVGWHGLNSDEFTDEGPYLVTGTDFTESGVAWDHCRHCDSARYQQDPYIQLEDHDLLLTKDGTIGKVTRVGVLPKQATLNSGVFVVRPLQGDYTTQYMFWVLRSDTFTEFIRYNQTGSTINHLYQDTFVNFAHPLPPLAEQENIAAFLDYETSRMDRLIEKQERLIELLKEKRQAVISHAVTKGLDPSVPMKDSGVEWLGEVPEHWKVAKGAILGRLIGSQMFSDAELLPTGKCSYLKVSDLSPIGFELREVKRFLPENIFPTPPSKSSFVVFPKRGAAIFTNKVNIAPQNSFFDPNLMGWIPSAVVDVKYLALLLSTRRLDDLADVSTVPQINNKHIEPEKFPMPPTVEQKRIVEYLNREMAVIADLLSKAHVSIKLTKERRTALISAAVTGKIDVRDWDPPSPNNQGSGATLRTNKGVTNAK